MLAAIELVTDKERKTPLPPEADAARRIFDRAWDNGLVIRALPRAYWATRRRFAARMRKSTASSNELG